MTAPESVYRYDLGPLLDLVRVPVEGGRFVHWLNVQNGRAGVAIVVTDGAALLLQRQWRPAVDAFVWQFPRGFGEPVTTGEPADARADARRELREETGIEGAELAVVGRVLPDPGILSTEVIVVEARVVAPLDVASLNTPDPTEQIAEFAAVPYAELPAWITEGRLIDGITLAALQVWQSARPSTSSGNALSSECRGHRPGP